MKHGGVYFSILVLLSFPLLADGHVPIIVSGNENLAGATYIENPTKSWAVYDELHAGGKVHYYRFHMTQGQILSLSLFVPEIDTFIPRMAIMGQGIESGGTQPDYLQVPDGSGVMIVEGKLPDQAVYEPFTPASQYNLAQIEINIEEEGTYYIGVYDPEQGGRYGLAIGSREEFGLYEWITVPINVIGLHKWEGQSLGLIIAPMLTVLIIGFIFLYQKKSLASLSLPGRISCIAGLLYLGSSAIMLTQMFIATSRAPYTPSIMITMLFAIIPILIGLLVLRIALHDSLNTGTRIKLAISGIIGLFFWAGLILGPVLVITAALFPSKNNMFESITE